jgi:2-polyprenyl-3-methyl-5-hydroxy-6-metoxy-1,4-benzoquinol methylase
MGWTVAPPAEEEAGKFYASDEYISHTDSRQSLADRLYHLARRFMLRRKGNLVDSAVRKSTGVILDIGSGTGYFADFMQKRGWQVTGIEISEQARNYSVERFGIRAIDPHHVHNLPSASADCITFWHVLEHLYDPAGWMDEVKRILKEDGRCIIALPNFASADAEWFGARWAALDVPRHLWHFTPDAFRRFAVKKGFVCESTSALPLDLFYISSLSYRNTGKGLPLLRGVLTGVVIALRSMFRRESASSLVYVLSKKES